jgi:CRISPR-associated protein Cas2
MRNWLIAYDIRDSRRLSRVHRYLKRRALPVQYSVFVFQGTPVQVKQVLNDMEELIHPDWDDIRLYHLPERSEVVQLGRKSFPEGVYLTSQGLQELLCEAAED